jgi:hypothetical protein
VGKAKIGSVSLCSLEVYREGLPMLALKSQPLKSQAVEVFLKDR